MGKIKGLVAEGAICMGCGVSLGAAVGYERACDKCAPYQNLTSTY